MGFFRKKPDPISERAKLLSDQIAAIEAEIQRLSERPEKEHTNGSPFAHPGSVPAPVATPAPVGATVQPRLRSTALPHHHALPVAAAAPTASVQAQEPVFEEVDQARLEESPESEPARATHSPDLGVRRHDAASAWQRFKHHFRGPVTSNPKLVHYLSAGSIQGLRPLRYEKRVARNRVIVLAAFLVLALWGVIAIFMSRN